MSQDVQAIKDAMIGKYQGFYEQFTELHRDGDEWRGPCPIHGGSRDDSFSVTDDGQYFCFADCNSGGDALEFLQRKEGLDFTQARAALAQFAHIDLDTKAPMSNSPKPVQKKPRPQKRIIKVYQYTDAQGCPRHEVVRYEPKGFGQRVPTDQPGVFQYSLHGVMPVLYRLPEVTAATKAGRAVYIAEGEKDADNLAGIGLCGTTCAMGASKWREEYSEALRGAKVVILPDNDEPGRKHAQQVAASLTGIAQRVQIVNLPDLPEHGDVSDWIAAGGTQADLVTLAKQAPDWTATQAGSTEASTEGGGTDHTSEVPYRETPRGLIWHKPTQSGPVKVTLTNFTARIVSDVQEDNGAEIRRYFEVEAARAGRVFRFPVAASAFAQMSWPMEHMGAAAIVLPGFGAKDHARAAIQMLSGEVPVTHVFGHTGWRELAPEKNGPGQWGYLHGGGAIGSDQPVQVSLPIALSGFQLPEPPKGDALITAIHAHFRLWTLAPDPISVPMALAPLRAALGGCDFSICAAGSSGVFKSEFAALSQQHFGAGLDARHLPGSWSSTDNALEGLAFTLKDALCVIDDFAPTGTAQDVARLHARADRVLRGQGNSAGKGRMNADGTLRVTKYSRGLILSTGEDVPAGQSLRARMLTLEIAPGLISPDRLTACQKDAAAGVYASAMSGLLAWVAPQYQAVQEELRTLTLSLRQAAQGSGQHKRTPGIAASLAAGLHVFLRFALEARAITQEERDALWQRGWVALGSAAEAQSQHQTASEPTARYRELLSAALASGRAHLAGSHGSDPRDPEAWGWRQREVGAGESYRTEWQFQGERIGWIDGEDLYLEPDAAYAVAKRLGETGGDNLTLSPKTMNKRLHERGLLVSTEGGQGTLTVRKMLEGQRRRVLHMRASILSASEVADVTRCDEGHFEETGTAGQILQPLDSFCGQIFNPQNNNLSTKNGEKSPARDGGKQAAGQIGQIGQISETLYTPGVNEMYTAEVESSEESMCHRAILGHLDIRCGQPEVATGIVRAMESAGFAPQTASQALRHLQDAGEIIRTASGFVASPASPLLD